MSKIGSKLHKHVKFTVETWDTTFVEWSFQRWITSFDRRVQFLTILALTFRGLAVALQNRARGVNVNVENSFDRGEVVSNLLQAQVFGLRQSPEHDRQGREQNGGEEEEGSRERQLFLHGRIELDAEDQHDASVAPGKSFAKGADFGWEEFA